MLCVLKKVNEILRRMRYEKNTKEVLWDVRGNQFQEKKLDKRLAFIGSGV